MSGGVGRQPKAGARPEWSYSGMRDAGFGCRDNPYNLEKKNFADCSVGKITKDGYVIRKGN